MSLPRTRHNVRWEDLGNQIAYLPIRRLPEPQLPAIRREHLCHRLTMKPVITGPSCIVSSSHINWSGWGKKGGHLLSHVVMPHTFVRSVFESRWLTHLEESVCSREQIYCRTKYLWQEERSRRVMRLNIDLSCLLELWHQ